MDHIRPWAVQASRRRTPTEQRLLKHGDLLDLWIEERPSGPTAVAVTPNPDRVSSELGKDFLCLEIVPVDYTHADLDARLAVIRRRAGRDFLGEGFVTEHDGRLCAAAYVIRATAELRRLEDDLPGIVLFGALNEGQSRM